MKNKRFILGFGLVFSMFLMLALSMFEIVPMQEKYDVVENEFLAQVDSYEHALMIQNRYDIDLLDLSDYGIARFILNDPSRLDWVIANNQDELVFNGIYKHLAPPWKNPEPSGDTYYNKQYALPMMQIPDAWAITEGSSDVIVAVIDTGIDTENSEFIGVISALSYNSVTKTVGIPGVMDQQGHGTAVSGVIAAKKDNDFGIAGIAQNIQLMVIRASADDSSSFTDSNVIDGIYYATNNGAQIINMSLGGGGRNSLMETAVNYAADQGVVIVAAAGNDGVTDLKYPAAFETVLSVSAVDSNKELASWSNYGETIAVSAPGVEIYTIGLNNGVIISSGTSLAAPQVAGVLALIKSNQIDLTREELIARLIGGAMDEGDPGWDIQYGHGIVNAYQSMLLQYHVVQFLDAEDQLIEEQWIAHGEAAIAPDAPTKASTAQYHYDFIGWDQSFSAVETDLVVRPVYQEIIQSYQVRFLDSDGLTILSNQTLEYGSLIVAPMSPVKAETATHTYSFSGWNPSWNETMTTTGNQDFVAVYEEQEKLFVYTFYDEDQTTILKQVAAGYGTVIVAPEDPIKAQSETHFYEFSGWTNGFEQGMLLVEDRSFVAIYQAVPLYYTYTFYGEDGVTILKQETKVYQSEIIAPTELTKANTPQFEYTFTGWSPVFIQGMLLVENVEFVAVFDEQIREYTYTFYDEDGTTILRQEVVDYGSLIVAPEDPIKVTTPAYEYVFTGYNPTFEEGMIITENSSFIAVFDEIVREYTYTFYDEDQTTILKQVSGPYGTTIVAPNDPLKESIPEYDYLFIGYSPNFTMGMILEDNISFVAMYDDIPRSYTYTFFDFDGVTILLEETDYYGTTIEEPTPVRENSPQYIYTFVGWDEEVPADGLLKENLSFVAVYDQELQRYTVNVHVDQDVTTYEVTFEESIVLPAISEDLKPFFLGWSDSGQNIQENMDIYALFRAREVYILAFYDEDETLIQSFEVLESAAFTNIPTPLEKPGFDVVWSVEDFTNVQENIDVYPIYTAIRYRIVFLDSDGEVLLEYEVGYNEIIEPIDAPKVDGFKFSAWYIGNRKYNFERPVTSNVELTAKYYQPVGCSLSLSVWVFAGLSGLGWFVLRRRKV